jgi:hypothetical protein
VEIRIDVDGATAGGPGAAAGWRADPLRRLAFLLAILELLAEEQPVDAGQPSSASGPSGATS